MITAPTLNPEKHGLINLLASYGIKDPILSLFEEIPRDLFVEKEYRNSAYEDRALPTRNGQTISQPSLVATTLQNLNLKGKERILEIGTGSGFQTALLSKLVDYVYSIERIPELAASARKRLSKLNIRNVDIVESDGSEGHEGKAPYDVIIVTAAFWQVPEPLSTQLKEGGKLIMPVGRDEWQQLLLYKKQDGSLVQTRRVSDVRFVPFIGKHAYKN